MHTLILGPIRCLQVEQDISFEEELIQKLNAADIRLDAYLMPDSSWDATLWTQFKSNLNSIENLLQGREPQIARSGVEIRSLFPLKEYSSTAYYSGPLLFGESFTIAVKVGQACTSSQLKSSELLHSPLAGGTHLDYVHTFHSWQSRILKFEPP